MAALSYSTSHSGQRDSGHAMSSLTNAFPPGKAIMDLITGRVKLDA
jgi:hypothetical protein